MNGLMSSLLADTLMGVIGVVSASAAACLMWESVRTLWLRRRQQRERARARREFWGYE